MPYLKDERTKIIEERERETEGVDHGELLLSPLLIAIC